MLPNWSRPFLALTAMTFAPFVMGSINLTSGFAERVLAVHNQERQSLGIEPLSWDPHLAVSAQQWANHLAASGTFEHAPDGSGEPQGENLWAGTRNYYSVESMVGAWVREKKFYRPGIFPNTSTTGKVADVGHFTQLAWRASQHVGCAVASGIKEDFLVCRYSEAGNYVGEKPF